MEAHQFSLYSRIQQKSYVIQQKNSVDKINIQWHEMIMVQRILLYVLKRLASDIYYMDIITCVYEISLFCPQSEKCIQLFVHKMESATVSLVHGRNGTFCILSAKSMWSLQYLVDTMQTFFFHGQEALQCYLVL